MWKVAIFGESTPTSICAPFPVFTLKERASLGSINNTRRQPVNACVLVESDKEKESHRSGRMLLCTPKIRLFRVESKGFHIINVASGHSHTEQGQLSIYLKGHMTSAELKITIFICLLGGWKWNRYDRYVQCAQQSWLLESKYFTLSPLVERHYSDVWPLWCGYTSNLMSDGADRKNRALIGKRALCHFITFTQCDSTAADHHMKDGKRSTAKRGSLGMRFNAVRG